ncbi:MAG: cellulase family glycosylhydrolase [Chloroflexaceae bacterium]|nr:cellulase family glycosylhydrolase [Chloroflexaceae bacterium]
MNRHVITVFAFIAVLTIILAGPLMSYAQQADARLQQQGEASQYFPETGHAAVGYFLNVWQNTPNATFVLGYPTSQPFTEESFTKPGEFYRVQYFQRAVLEEIPEFFGVEDNRYFVQGRLLGSQLAAGREQEPSFQPVADPGDGTWFENTQHTLRDDPAPFRTFWLNNGGLDTFGYPISEPLQEVNQADNNTYWVQYFERQRMEWHPEEPDPTYQVQLGLLGNELRDANHADNMAFDPLPPPVAQDPNAPTSDGTRPAPFIYGYNAHLFGAEQPWQDRQRVLQLSKDSGVYWIRQQVGWEYLQPSPSEIRWKELDHVVDDTHNAGVNMLISVVRAPSWATPDGDNGMPSAEHIPAFANLMGEMAARYRGKIQAYQIWNEQNLAHENGGEVASADHYVNMMAAAYDAIKAADPDAIVVSGGPSSTETNKPDVAISDVTFMRQMLSNPNFRTDFIGVHPGGQYNPPDTMWPDEPGPGPHWRESREFYFRRVEDIRQVMVETGWGDRQIWLTEFGWATTNNTPGYEYGNSTSFETQAEWIARAFEKGRYEYTPWMAAMFLWNLNFAVPWEQFEGNPLHEQASFGVLNGDWSPRPAWYAISNIPKE